MPTYREVVKNLSFAHHNLYVNFQVTIFDDLKLEDGDLRKVEGWVGKLRSFSRVLNITVTMLMWAQHSLTHISYNVYQFKV